MSASEAWHTVYEQALDSIQTGRAYHARSGERYLRTAMLVDRCVPLGPDSHVAEVGAGLLLPMLCARWKCAGTAYGFLLDSWRDDLARLGIGSIGWDANVPLDAAQAREQYDLVLLCEVIEHLNRWPVEFLIDLNTLLRPGGFLLLTTVNIVRLTNRLRMLRGKSPLIDPFERTPDGSNHVREYSLQEVQRYLRQAGLEPVCTETWSIYPPGLAGRAAALIGAFFPSVRNYFAIVALKKDEGV